MGGRWGEPSGGRELPLGMGLENRMNTEPADRLKEYFATLRRRGLDSDVASAAEQWAAGELRRTNTSQIENLALRGVVMHRRSGSKADTVASQEASTGSAGAAVADLVSGCR